MGIKVFLADDEPIILRGLKKLINWSSFGAEIIGEANNGHQAVEFILENKPDVVVSDICMPQINGIEVLKMIKDRNMSTKVIFLSGYQEFSYARDAVAFGAVEYILKPIDKAQLENALSKAINLIHKEEEEERVRRKLSGYESESKSRAMDRFLDGLSKEYDFEESPKTQLASLGIHDQGEYFTVLNMTMDDLDQKESPLSEQEKRLVKFAVINMIEQVVNGYEGGIVFHKGKNICAILHHPDREACSKLRDEIVQEARNCVRVQTNKTMTIGLGEIVRGMDQIPKSHADSMQALQRRYFSGKDRVLTNSDVSVKNYKIEDLHDLQKSLAKSIISHEKEAASEKIQMMMDIIAGISRGVKDSAISYCLSAIAFLKKEISGTGIAIEDTYGNEEDPLNQLRDLESWSEVKAWMNEYAASLFQTIASAVKHRDIPEIAKVKEYIENNSHRNITLESAASIACMNAYYFSSFFKKHTGENFKDFLTRIRMEKALVILLTTDCKVYEIAEKVGFNDSRHFSDMFRKYYGSNPMDYKNNIKKSGE